MSNDGDPLTRVLPDHDIGREVGRGAFGRVLVARHRQLGREVAVKQLDGPVAGNPEHTARFRREARVLAQLDHPHVVRVFDFRESEGLHVLVMELLGGATLRERMDAGMSPESAVAATLAAAVGLHHVHEQGVLHRDVKPENLMFDAKGTLKVTDFGLARGDDVRLTAVALTAAGDSLMGTPAYMAPEQADGDGVGPAADQYALAAVLYEALSGRLTHPADAGAMKLLASRMTEPAPPLVAVAPGVPGEISAVVARALATDPGGRYPDVEAFAASLAAAATAAWGPGWLDRADVSIRDVGVVRDAAEGRTPRSAAVVPSPAVVPPAAVPPPPAVPPPTPPRPGPPGRWVVVAAVVALLVALGVAAAVVSSRDDDRAAGVDQPGDGGGTTSTTPAAAPLAEVWATPLGDDIVSSPAVSGSLVLVGSDDFGLHALDAATGVEQWSFPTRRAVRSSPTVVGDSVFVGSDDGALYCVGLTDHAERWRAQLTTQIVSSPASDGDVVIVGADALYAFGAADGAQRWRYATGDDVVSSPAIGGGLAVVGSNDGFVHAVDLASGEGAWTVRTPDDVVSSPVIDGDRVYIGSAGGVLGIDLASGEVEVEIDLDGTVSSSPAVSDGTLVVATSAGADSALVAIDVASGDVAWSVPTGAAGSSPAVDDGVVAVGTGDGSVLIVALADGSALGRATTGGAVVSSPAFDGDRVVVGSFDGELHAFTGWARP